MLNDAGYSHINPSCPGCFPILSIFLISSSETSSLLKSPPWTTKKRFRPSGDNIAPAELDGSCVAVINVASGTDFDVRIAEHQCGDLSAYLS